MQAPQQAAVAPAMPSGAPPGSIDLTAPMSDDQLLHLGHRMLQDTALARSIGQDYPSVYKRVRRESLRSACCYRAQCAVHVLCSATGMWTQTAWPTMLAGDIHAGTTRRIYCTQ